MKLLRLLLATSLLLSGVACTGAAGTGGGTGSGVLTVFGSDPISLDPALMSDTDSAEYVVEIFSGLTSLDQKLQVVPDLAESWDVSPDGKTYTFKLRQNAKFHDGRAITADDFKFSFERAADPKTQSHTADTYLGDILGVREKLAGSARELSGVKVIDPHTLQIQIEAPRFYFLAKMTYPTAFVVDKANVESGKTWTDKPNGSGPFKLKEWTKGTRIVLERNSDFYTEPAKLQEVTYLLAGGNGMTMYENDEVDITGVALSDIERVKDPTNPLNKELIIAPQLSVGYVGFNVLTPPFDDVKVRQAFNMAVDKEKILSALYRDLIPVAYGILPPGMPGYNPSLRGLKFDAAQAKRLLSESKYGNNLPPIKMSIASSTSQTDPFTEAIIEQWRTNLGVDVRVEMVEPAIFYSDIRRNPATGKTNKFQSWMLGWSADYPDPQDFLDILLHSKSLDNNGSYANAEADRLLEAARAESDAQKRFKLYQDAEQIMVNDAPWVPLYFSRYHMLVKSKVKGYVPAPMIIPSMKYISVE